MTNDGIPEARPGGKRQLHMVIDAGLDEWIRLAAFHRRVSRTAYVRAILLSAQLEDLTARRIEGQAK